MELTIIGAGPRGIMTLGRLVAWLKTAPTTDATVTVVDPYPIGGNVWRTDQPSELIMNTPAQQITLYADDSVTMAGDNSVTGPNLADWSQQEETASFISMQDYANAAFLADAAAALEPNGYAPRNLYGVYIQWVAADLLNQAPSNLHVVFRQATVTDVTRGAHGFIVHTATDHWPAEQVALTVGHYVMRPTDEEKQFKKTAEDNHGFYLPPILPGDADFSDIQAGETVLMRGVGLSFYDYTAMLTEGRGGQFKRNADNSLVYLPSGKEPKIVAGSRRGFPYYPKGYNQKAYGEQDEAQFLTTTKMNELAQENELSGDAFFALLKRDAELVYYQRLIAAEYPTIDESTFTSAFINADDPDTVIAKSGIEAADRLDWDALLVPLKDVADDDLQTTISTRVDQMVNDALKGTKTGPLTSALEVFRDLRDQIRYAVEHNLFNADDYLNFILRWYTPTQDFISVGPPVVRLEQLLALMKAGVVRFMEPQIQVSVENGQFVAQSKNDAETVTSRVLIEARTPGINATQNANPVLEALLKSGMAAPDRRTLADGTQYFTHAIDLEPKTDQLVDHDGQVVTGLYIFGIPTEGRHWMTTASPRPGVDDGNLSAADRIAQQMVTNEHTFADHLWQ